MAALTGWISIKIDGDTILSKHGAFEFDPGGYERTEQIADGKIIGFTRKPVASMVSGNCQHTSETDMRAIAEHESVTVTIEFDSGSSYNMRDAFATKPPKISGENGDMEVEYKGLPADKIA